MYGEAENQFRVSKNHKNLIIMKKKSNLLEGFEAINDAKMNSVIAGGTSWDTETVQFDNADCGPTEADEYIFTYLDGDLQPTSFSMDT
jgi:hypothetical protein